MAGAKTSCSNIQYAGEPSQPETPSVENQPAERQSTEKPVRKIQPLNMSRSLQLKQQKKPKNRLKMQKQFLQTMLPNPQSSCRNRLLLKRQQLKVPAGSLKLFLQVLQRNGEVQLQAESILLNRKLTGLQRLQGLQNSCQKLSLPILGLHEREASRAE